MFYAATELVQQAAGQLENSSAESNFELVHLDGGQLNSRTILCKIPWKHHVTILSKCQNIGEAKFYIQQTIQNNWSRNVLEIQISSGLVNRLGKAQNNFELTLPKPQSDLAIETLKDPYKLIFLHLKSMFKNWNLKNTLPKTSQNFY